MSNPASHPSTTCRCGHPLRATGRYRPRTGNTFGVVLHCDNCRRSLESIGVAEAIRLCGEFIDSQLTDEENALAMSLLLTGRARFEAPYWFLVVNDRTFMTFNRTAVLGVLGEVAVSEVREDSTGSMGVGEWRVLRRNRFRDGTKVPGNLARRRVRELYGA